MFNLHRLTLVMIQRVIWLNWRGDGDPLALGLGQCRLMTFESRKFERKCTFKQLKILKHKRFQRGVKLSVVNLHRRPHLSVDVVDRLHRLADGRAPLLVWPVGFCPIAL